MIKRKNIPDIKPDIDIRSEEERTLDILLESNPTQSCQELSDWIINMIKSIKQRYQPQIEINVNPNLVSLYSIEARPRIIPVKGYQGAGINPMEGLQRKIPLNSDGAFRACLMGYQEREYQEEY